MTLDRRTLLGSAAAAAAVASSARVSQAAASAEPTGSRSAALFLKEDDGLEPARVDRLPLDWHKGRVKALQNYLQQEGLAGALLTDRWNLIYFTGLFHSTTERPFSVFLPADRMAAIWFHPSLDRDLVSSWWSTEADSYFDFLHADGAFPNEGKVQQGRTVDLFEWTMRGLKKRGLEGKRIATDRDLSTRQRETASKVFTKETRFESIADRCERMRAIKTPEELALWRRAYRVFDETHAFARDLLLEKGTDLTDFALGHAAEEFGMNLLIKDIKRDGAPHTAVGIQLGVAARTGRGTAYPHPNQFHHSRIQKGSCSPDRRGRADRGVRRGALPGLPHPPLERPPQEAMDRIPRLLSDAEGALARRDRVLHGRVPDPSAPGEGRRLQVHLPPAGARHGDGRPPTSVSGAGGLHDARVRHDLFRRARAL
jgi:creatinase/prolidase-like protein